MIFKQAQKMALSDENKNIQNNEYTNLNISDKLKEL